MFLYVLSNAKKGSGGAVFLQLREYKGRGHGMWSVIEGQVEDPLVYRNIPDKLRIEFL
jgi:hypothetical protein